jgi:hypothetical protein
VTRFVAGPTTTAGVARTPISATNWMELGGTYQALGGTWNTSNHTFTASSVTSGTSGSPVNINRATAQRVLVNDNGPGGTNWEIDASFLSGTGNTTFTATAISDRILGSRAVLSGWTCSTTGYDVSSTNPLYLSFKVGAGHSLDDLALWNYDGSTWSAYTSTDLTYDGTYASFTATSLSGFAVTGGPLVPEPGTFALLAAGLAGLLAYSCRSRRQL